MVQKQHNPEVLLQRLASAQGPDAYVVAVPDDRSDWLSVLRVLCIEGSAWQSVHSIEPTGYMSTQGTPPAVHVRYGHRRRSKVTRTVTVQWYVVYPAAGDTSSASVPFDIHKYIAIFSYLTKRKRCVWLMPPRELYPTLGAARERQVFRHTWSQLSDVRRVLFRKGMRREDLAAHMQQVRSLIPVTGVSWMRKVHGISKAWSFPYDRKGCLIYAVVNDLNGNVYIGQTGGKQNLRSLVQRFKEHVLGGINFQRKKHRYDPSEWSIYEAMHKLGVHHFFIVPLEIVDRCQVDEKEYHWISKFGSQVYNCTRETKWRSQRNMKRFFVHPKPLPRGDLTHLANRYVQMRSPPLPEMLNLWTRSRDRLPQALRRSLWDRLVTVAQDSHGVKLPKRLVFPHPPCTQTDLQDLRALVHGLIGELPAPRALKAYLRAITVFVAKRASTVRDVMCTKGTTLSWEALQQKACAQCRCASYSQEFPRVQGCVAVRDVRQLRQLLPTGADGLLQNMSNSVLGPVALYVTQARQAVWRAAKACPFLPVTWRSSLVDDAVHLTRRLFTTVAAQVPEALQRDHLLSVKRTINRQFVVLPLD